MYLLFVCIYVTNKVMFLIPNNYDFFFSAFLKICCITITFSDAIFFILCMLVIILDIM